MHPNNNEMQYILDEGTASSQIVPRQGSARQAGRSRCYPEGRAHGGTKPDGAVFRAIAIKKPPQKPDDTKMLE